MNKSKGIACAMIAAFIYGFTPILARITYMDGSNTVSLTFYRSLMSLPIIFAILKVKKIPIGVTKTEFGKLAILGFLGACLTGLTLYGAYNYISVGLTTTIHYIYPVLVAMACILFFKDKISKIKVMALVLSMAGILLFFEGDVAVNAMGLFLAVISGVAYAIYLILMDKSGISGMHPFKITFYACLVASIFLFLFGTVTHQLVYTMTPRGWAYTAIVSVFISVVANSLMPVAVKLVGSTVTAILGMFEPIICVILGILFLGEPCTPRSIAGCVLIITAVILLTLEKEKGKEEGKKMAEEGEGSQQISQ